MAALKNGLQLMRRLADLERENATLKRQLGDVMQQLMVAEGERDLLGMAMGEMKEFRDWLLEQDLSSTMSDGKAKAGYHKQSVEGWDDTMMSLTFARRRGRQ